MFSLDWAFRFVPQQGYERNNKKILFYKIYAFRNDRQIDIKIMLIIKKRKRRKTTLPHHHHHKSS